MLRLKDLELTVKDRTKSGSTMTCRLTAFLLVLGFAANGYAQGPAMLHVRVTHQGAPIAGARITVNTSEHSTDAKGEALLALAAGAHTLTIQKDGFVTATLEVE